MNKEEPKPVEGSPIRTELAAFRASFNSVCKDRDISCSPDTLSQLSNTDLRRLSLNLLVALQNLPAARLVPSRTGRGTLESDLLRLLSAVTSDNFDFARIKELLKKALTDKPQDTLIWDLVSGAAVESTPPPRPIPSTIHQTPLSQNTSGLVNSSEFRHSVDPILKLELEHLYAGLPHFHKAFFGDVPDLNMVSEDVFRKCSEGDTPLFREGWSGWPAAAKESDVLTWFGDLIPKLEAFAGDRISTPATRRKLLAQPRTPLESRYRWSHILVAGELKSNPKADTASVAWIDLARYAREVFAAQDTRRFVLGFTLCGSRMRVWEFDRLGGIASEQFDINKEEGGVQFVATTLGFLRMNEEMLGFDPTVMTSGDQQYIEIERNDKTERLLIDKVMKRARCIAGRATICWRAHSKEDPQTPLVIKDSWQYTDRDEEGQLLREATDKGRSSGAGVKRPSSEMDAALPPCKRSGSTSPVKASIEALPNRIHRRVILRDYGKPIYNASSPVALLATLEGCIEGHQSLYKAGFLHRDISINNLMINEDDENPSQRAFLIDLDLAIKAQREGASGAKGKTGTRAFMAIGALLGNEQHSFMHDLESFFWVLFWICIHYNGPDDGKTVPRFEKWNYVDTEELAELKKGQVSHERDFINTSREYFTTYYQPLVPWVNILRKAVFPNGGRWEKEDDQLYLRMKEIIREAQKDAKLASV
ncbi:hypothetical protein HRG_007198 [Hirsutella rhossiliensis]|uniref:non-specific serine/threonine protein kinase n=1 Tax=Hirsutella rhossiliensis TaxID=111463 RepID=A0A9P8SGJ4_9HYPO|nr:uncharacterized protein HRG_07198 [Hirsutella rhossiliensis]KAH0962118.1 hypothetical protein HRG_07198 [Hirsutella rhossiliensis]